MKELLEYIIKNLVSKPDQVEITEEKQKTEVNLTLKVDPGDMGVVIGKGGQTIRAIRKLLIARAQAEKTSLLVNLQLAEPGK